MNARRLLLAATAAVALVALLYLVSSPRAADDTPAAAPATPPAAAPSLTYPPPTPDARPLSPETWTQTAFATHVLPVLAFSPGRSTGHANVHAILAATETAPDARGLRERRWLLRTDMKYPLVRVVDTLRTDPATGAEVLVTREAMSADHVVATLPHPQSRALLARAGLTVRHSLRGGSDLHLLAFHATSPDTLNDVLATLARHPDYVGSPQPDRIAFTADMPEPANTLDLPYVEGPADEFGLPLATASAAGESGALATSNDPLFTSLWGMRNQGQLVQGSGFNGFGSSGMDGNAHGAWNTRTSAASVVVGVIDTGIRTTHQDLNPNIWINTGESGTDNQGRDKKSNGVDDDGNGWVDDYHGINAITNTGQTTNTTNDDHGHGTHCAGTIGAVGNNSIGVAGVAWNVRLMSLKFLSSTGSGHNSDSVQCMDYARQMGAHITSNSYGHSGGADSAQEAAIGRLRDAGVLFVVAAGNSNQNMDTYPHNPGATTAANALCVAAMAPTGLRASFSNYSTTRCDVAAPGVCINSTSFASDTSYTTMSGTSMATPFVAGLCALARAQFPDLGYAELLQRVTGTVDTTSHWQGLVLTGGRVNAAGALTSGVPAFTAQPASLNAAGGQNVTLACTVEFSGGPVTYQWRRNGTPIAGATSASLALGAVDTGDFGAYEVRVTGGGVTVASGLAQLGVFGAADDFNGDGKADLLFFDRATGRRSVWFMDGGTVLTTVLISGSNLGWQMQGTGDFNSDGKPDLLFYNIYDGRRSIWLMDGTTVTSTQTMSGQSLVWQPRGVGDFDGDGHDDLLFYNVNDGRRSIWFLNGTSVTSQPALPGSSLVWQPVGAGDFNGDGKDDIVFLNVQDGRRSIWYMDGITQTSSTLLSGSSLDWQPVGAADFNADGHDDLIFFSTYSGRRSIWLMQGTSVSSTAALSGSSLNWLIRNR